MNKLLWDTTTWMNHKVLSEKLQYWKFTCSDFIYVFNFLYSVAFWPHLAKNEIMKGLFLNLHSRTTPGRVQRPGIKWCQESIPGHMHTRHSLSIIALAPMILHIWYSQ